MTAAAIEVQVARMRELYPDMRLVGVCDWMVAWTGPVQPLQRTYTIKMLYVRRSWIGDCDVINSYEPVVRLVRPQLVERHPQTGEWTPHLYWRRDAPAASTLCLYDPATSEWSREDLVADTAMPWVSDWLACYEGWLATGAWAGGGRHPLPRHKEANDGCAEEGMEASEPRGDRPERGGRDAFHWIGRRIGTFASFPLMAAASAGSSRPLSWRDWKRAISPAGPLPGISTSSPEPRPAAFLVSALPPAIAPPRCAISTSSAAARYFHPADQGFLGRAHRRLRAWQRLQHYSYERGALERILLELLGGRTLGAAGSRLCIPSFEGEHGEVYIFKTPHHPDFTKDQRESMVKVGLATSAAPGYFRPLRDGGYTFVDGGVWANNPIMIALVEALTSFAVSRERIRILSVGCGSEPYSVSGRKLTRGGLWHWRDIINAAMSLQSQNALGQAGLLIGLERVVRIDVPPGIGPIELDDWRAAAELLRPAAAATHAAGERIWAEFLATPALRYTPLVTASEESSGDI